jgi:rfaE bifunctional protein nucleotidyltransferase chain/domain
VELNDLYQACTEARTLGRKIVLCHGVFDVIHAGHIQHLKGAKSYGDVLVVTLTPDEFVRKGPGRPIFNQQTRAAVMSAIQGVNFVAVNDSPDAMDVLKTIQPDVYCKGEEVLNCPSGHIVEEKEFVESYGGRVVFMKMVGDLSSSKIINQTSLNPELAKVVRKVKDIVSYQNIVDYFAKLKDLRILVVGEYIRDEYVICKPLNRSSKDMIVPMRYTREEVYDGGAAIVAINMAQFCDNVSLVTAGRDLDLSDIINLHLVDHPTIRKRRLVEEGTGHKVAELIYLDEQYDDEARASIGCAVHSLLNSVDLVVVCDYGHGLFSSGLITCIKEEAPFLAANVQTNSANFGYNLAAKWTGTGYMVIDEKELRLACRDRLGAIGDLVRDSNLANILSVTLGYKGSVTYQEGGYVEHFPPIASSVVDTIGAGDAFLSITAPLVALDMPLEVVGLLGNAYGSMKVSIFGNRPVDAIEFKQFIKGLLV